MKKIVMGICALMLSVASYAQVGKTTISGHFNKLVRPLSAVISITCSTHLTIVVSVPTLAMSLLRMFVVSLSSTTTSTRIT